MDQAILVLDVGKTHSKLTLVSLEGGPPAKRARANPVTFVDGRPVLDASGIETWLRETMAELGRQARICAIVPVAHGAAAALVEGDRLAAPVLDYEAVPPLAVSRDYDAQRDPFERTLSPRLPGGLNLGLQLFWLEPSLTANCSILPWAQYWAFVLSGEKSTEVTSLGCHSDLWFPKGRSWSDLARRRGWSERFAPLRKASEVLGVLRPELARTTGLPRDCVVLCGLHDSNASLLAARAAQPAPGSGFALVSTGTWFVAMRSGDPRPARLDETQSALGNVDVHGDVVPSARFFGGREARDVSAREGATAAADHLARQTAGMLQRIDAQGPVTIEGRFAADPLFPRALARLWPAGGVHTLGGGDGVAIGAARLHAPEAVAAPRLRSVELQPVA